MVILKGILKDSRDHYRQVDKRIRERLKKLPKGSVFSRKIRGKRYYYLNYRVGEKVIQKYLGPQEPAALLKEIGERKKLKQQLKGVRQDLHLLSKTLKPKSRG